MKLSKALKLKNTLAQEVNELLEKCIQNNCFVEGSTRYYNSVDLLAQYRIKLGELNKLKTQIHLTSEPIRHMIFGLGEIKNYLNKINSLNTTEGPIKSYGSSEPMIMKCDINEPAKQALVKEAKEQIENLQEQIDVFNATTELVEI